MLSALKGARLFLGVNGMDSVFTNSLPNEIKCWRLLDFKYMIQR
jgi:hypothetical protein